MEETQYDKLKTRIYEIIDNFSFEQVELEPPNKKQEDLIRAMIVLCHAEFEDYLEELADNLLTVGENKWSSEGVANKNIASLFINTDKLKRNPQSSEHDMNVTTFSIKTIKAHRDWIKMENHGIKRKNIENMYMPLGYEVNEFNQNFLNELDAFGVDRGKVAHSASTKTRSILDYNSEKNKILNILGEIEEFEKEL